MTIPGFTAEAALFKSKEGYQEALAMHQSSGPVEPAIYPGSSCATLCRPCEEVGGDCIHLGNGRCVCA